MEYLDQLNHWHWFAAGITLVILEVFVSGAMLMWMGVAAGVVGALLWMFPEMAWKTQSLLFAVLSITSIILWQKFFKPRSENSDHPTLNRRGEQHIGRTFVLENDLHNGHGKLTIDHSMWSVTGPDLPAGTRIKIIGSQGVTLICEPAD